MSVEVVYNFLNKIFFLMMIGFSLLVEGLGYHIPKGYLYAAIGFSILVEAFNQAVRRNRERFITSSDLRERTADAVLSLSHPLTINRAKYLL